MQWCIVPRRNGRIGNSRRTKCPHKPSTCNVCNRKLIKGRCWRGTTEEGLVGKRKFNYRWRGPPDSSVFLQSCCSWLVWGGASRHQKTCSNYPRDRQVLLTWWLNGIFSEWKRHYDWTEGPKILLKVDCLHDAVGKQPLVPLINFGRKWTLNWWWWWWWWWWW